MENLPTKADLLHGELVDITANHKNVETNSLKIAKSLDVQHSDVTRNIKRLIKSGAISQRNIAVSDYLSERGKSYQYYHLKEVEALQVIMSLSGSKAEQLHKELAQAFVSVKKENAEWRLSETIERLRNESINPERIYYDVMTMLKEKTPQATKLEGAFHNAT